MSFKTLVLLPALLALSAGAQTVIAPPTVTPTDIQLQFQDAAGTTYSVDIPYTVTFAAGTAQVTITTPPPPPPPPPPPTASAEPVIPSTAIAVAMDPLTDWIYVHDAGTPGTSTGTAGYPVSGVSADNLARSFSMTYSSHGGERWSANWGSSTSATHFVYDVQVFSPDWSQVSNLELDTNQVTADGKTFILGTQCSIYSHSWEYTLTDTSTGKWHWVPSSLACDPTKWTPNTWHHIRIFGHRDSKDVATYEGVSIDGTYSPFVNAVGATGRNLGWSIGHLVENFQIDGARSTSGSILVYSDKFTMYRW